MTSFTIRALLIGILLVSGSATHAAIGDPCDPNDYGACGLGAGCQNNVCVAHTPCDPVCDASSEVCMFGECVPRESTYRQFDNSGPAKTMAWPLGNPLQADSLMELLLALLQTVVLLGSIALLIALVWVGAQFVFAQGAPEKLQTARRALVWTLIGGLILLGAETIALIIEATAVNISP